MYRGLLGEASRPELGTLGVASLLPATPFIKAWGEAKTMEAGLCHASPIAPGLTAGLPRRSVLGAPPQWEASWSWWH